MKGVFVLIGVPAWVVGIVIAKGFWSTFFAVILPLWGWYLTTEWLLTRAGLI